MKTHLRFASKCVVFICILCICIKCVYRIIVPKFFVDNMWPTTSTYIGFYEMEEDTVDVLFLGSSHAATSFIPQELYDNYGIASYNLGCEMQNMVTSYFWLKEALRYQQPKVVFLDCFLLFEYDKSEPLNSAESCTRKALDYMRWSPVKFEAVKTICELDARQSLFSYYFPNIRYHTRWTRLSENDFMFSDMGRHYELKGYTPLSAYVETDNYSPFKIGISEDEADIVPLMGDYLDRIAALCEQNGITLILTKTVTTMEDETKYNVIQKYADERNLLFLDFNVNNLYEEIDYCFLTDNNDVSHANLWGAKKVTNYIGELLVNQFGMAAKYDLQWETTKSYYEGTQRDCRLIHTTDIDEYLTMLRDSRYSIFISAKDDCTLHLRDSSIQNLRNMGLQADLQDNYQCSYLAVLSQGSIEEQAGYNKLEQSDCIRGGFAMYDIISAGNGCGNESSIIIDDMEQAKGGRGLNIVVYNNDRKQVIDSVCFDTHVEENTAMR